MADKKKILRKRDFTDAVIKSLKAVDGESTEYYDSTRQYGNGVFGLRVSPKGKKVFFMMYRNNTGKLKRLSLGEYPKINLKDAREKANGHMVNVKEGQDPNQELKDYKESPTVKDLWNEYQLSLTRLQKPKSPNTIKEEKRKWDSVIEKALGDYKVQDIKPMHITKLLNKIADTSPVSANRMHSFLRTLFKQAMSMGWIEVHPMQWLSKPGGSEAPRKRFLDDQEIKVLWEGFETLQPNQRDILKLILLTAQRPGEIMSMQWNDIDFDKAIWINRDTKTGNDHLVPLSEQVLDLLKSRKSGASLTNRLTWMINSPYVFPSSYNTTPRTFSVDDKDITTKGAESGVTKSTKKARAKLQKDTGITGWTAHDLRRTARTIMSRLNIKHHVRERVLNHAQNGIAGVYDQFDYMQEKSDALCKLANEIDRIIGKGQQQAKIIKLKVA